MLQSDGQSNPYNIHANFNFNHNFFLVRLFAGNKGSFTIKYKFDYALQMCYHGKSAVFLHNMNSDSNTPNELTRGCGCCSCCCGERVESCCSCSGSVMTGRCCSCTQCLTDRMAVQGACRCGCKRGKKREFLFWVCGSLVVHPLAD